MFSFSKFWFLSCGILLCYFSSLIFKPTIISFKSITCPRSGKQSPRYSSCLSIVEKQEALRGLSWLSIEWVSFIKVRQIQEGIRSWAKYRRLFHFIYLFISTSRVFHTVAPLAAEVDVKLMWKMCFNAGPLNRLTSSSAALTPALHAWPFECVSSLGLRYIYHVGRQIKGSIKTRANVAFICWGLSIKQLVSLISLSSLVCRRHQSRSQCFVHSRWSLQTAMLEHKACRAVAELVLLSSWCDLTASDGASYFLSFKSSYWFFSNMLYFFIIIF